MSLATASTKTPHRRRRKANVSDKENRGNAFIEVLDDGCVIFQERDTLPDRDNDNQYSLVLAATLLKFRGAVSLVPTALAIFQEHCNLDESVIRCSLFPQRTTGLLHVQDHTAELLSLSRKVIKQATQEGAKDGDKLLLIAVHCLRAIVALKNRDSTVETCIRLLYHCIIAACGEDSLIAIAGFEALHNVLQEYECLSSDGRKVRFSSAPNMWTGAVLPCFVNASSVDGTMTLRQVVTIVLKTCLACLTRTYHHWCEGAPKSTSTLARVEQAAATYGALARRLMQAPPTNEPLHYFLLLMRSSYLSWLSFVADSDDQECIKDLCTHCKSAHHYFWDKAMKLKDTDEVFSSTRKLNDYCLYLRQSAIELLLPVSQSNQGKRLVYEHLWKPACEYAWKAASVHAQQGFSLPVTADSTLAKFHLIIGSKLDSFHVSQHHSVSYVEYCVHRAMHCGISPMFHTYREPHQWKLDPQEEIDMGSLLLSVALLGIRAKYSLTVFCEDVVVEEWCHTSSSFEEWNDYLDQLICHFPSLLLAKWAALPADTHNRYFKLFSALSFHRSIFEVLKTDHRTINRNALQLLARVLSNIIGPLLLLVAKSCQEQSKENYLLETALECYFRPLAAFEVLRETSTGKGNEAHNYEVLANKTIHAMHQAFHMEGRVSTSILEKCAKSISTVARQRTVASNTNACIVPTLYSLTFYTFLSKQLERESKYQLSGRLAHLANALQLSGYYFHAKVVLACVIAEELPDCYNDHLLEWDEIDFLRFLATRSKHMFAPLSSTCQLTKLARSSVRRIISLGNETLYQDNRREPDLEFKGAWDAFLGSCVSKRVFTDLCEANQDNQYISVLLPRVLEWRQQEEKDSRSSSLRLFLLFVDVLIELGASFEGSSEGGEVPWQVEDCLATVKHLKGSLIPLLSSSPGYLGAFVHAVAATALADSKTGDYSKYAFHEDNVSCDDENARFQSSLRLANDALSCFDSSDCQEQNDAMCREVLATIVHHFCWRLEAHQGYEATAKLFHRCQATMELVRKSTQNTNDEIYEFCRSSLLWVLSHFQNQLESIGDSIRSVILMDWILQLLNEDDIDEQSWFRSAAISTFLSSPFSNKNVKFDFKKSLSSCSSGSMEWLAQKELNVATLRARIAFGADCEASSLLELAQSIHQEIQAVVLSQTNLDVLLSWLLSSTKLLFAELAASRGFFAESLQYLQEACRLCLTVISSSRWTSPSHGDVSRWEHIALSTLLLRANRRYIELLGLRSKLHARIGDHRKAIAYLSTLSHFLGADFKHIDKSQGPNVGEILSSEMCLEIKNFRRLNAEITCSATSQDLVLSRLEETGLRWLQSAFTNADDSSLHLQAILDVLSVGDLVYGESITSSFQTSFPLFYKDAMNWYHKLASKNLFETHGLLILDSATAIAAKVAIREIRCLFHRHSKLDIPCRFKVRALCHSVQENVAADANDRAWAYYYEADLEIAALGRSGALDRLWTSEAKETSKEDNESLQHARDCLAMARLMHPTGSDIVSRLILRNLALVTGPENGGINSSSAGALVLMSIGQSYRQRMIRALCSSNPASSASPKSVTEAFNIFEENEISRKGSVCLLDRLAEVTPTNWKFVATTLCPSGDLLVTSIEKDSDVDKMRVRTSRMEATNAKSVYDDMMVPLDEIIRDSQNQLFGMDVTTVSERYSEEAAKRRWWESRRTMDEKLMSLLLHVENTYFPSLHLRTGSDDCIFHVPECGTLPVGNLASRFDAAVEGIQPKPEDSEETLRKLTIPKLKQRLIDEFGFAEATFRKMKKQDLIDLILSETVARKSSMEDVPCDGCLFLILDENLHRFPFEGMPSLAGHAVCRVPSLAFVLASLLEKGVQKPGQTPVVNPCKASYVLDPENNLVSSRKRLQPVLNGIAREHDWDWNSVVGEIPHPSFFEQGLGRQDSLFMYFGHGGAQTCYSRKQVESLISKHNGHDVRACSATVILMGCSSGRLVSVNRKDSLALEQLPLYYEPEGIALSYLCAGAPCVVGNLWDVTDHDIDRYSTTLLETFLQSDGCKSLACCVATARTACKLPFIVGCAPVCYGVPVHMIT